jgi:hypothetical protein
MCLESAVNYLTSSWSEYCPIYIVEYNVQYHLNARKENYGKMKASECREQKGIDITKRSVHTSAIPVRNPCICASLYHLYATRGIKQCHFTDNHMSL